MLFVPIWKRFGRSNNTQLFETERVGRDLYRARGQRFPQTPSAESISTIDPEYVASGDTRSTPVGRARTGAGLGRRIPISSKPRPWSIRLSPPSSACGRASPTLLQTFLSRHRPATLQSLHDFFDDSPIKGTLDLICLVATTHVFIVPRRGTWLIRNALSPLFP